MGGREGALNVPPEPPLDPPLNRLFYALTMFVLDIFMYYTPPIPSDKRV